MGDPNGIGPEVVLKHVASATGDLDYVLTGWESVFEHYARRFSLEDALRRCEVVAVSERPIRVEEGTVSERAGTASMQAVDLAVQLCRSGRADAVVTAPISKEAIALAGYDVPGHTEYIERICGGKAAMIMVAPGLRIALVTSHIPISSVSANVTRERIVERGTVFRQSLVHDFGVPSPRIAVLALNPHAGDGGVIGTEERDVFEPALQQLRSEGINADGPHPADGFFGQRRYLDYDGVLAAYHDQGLVPFKALSFGRGVNFTAGLPIVRTSPDHGTAFGIAGRGVASSSSVTAAVELAVRVVETRKGRSL